MSDLKNLQQEITDYVLGKAPAESLLSSIVKTPLSATDRLQIHQNNFRLTLSSALSGVYPIVMSFVGSDWLEAALKKFVVMHPPQIASLAHYGGGFADFLDSFEPAASMPYLGDVARLEWAIHECQNAGEEKLLTAKDWKEMSGPDVAKQTLPLVKAHKFVVSEYPLLDLWHVGNGVESGGEINLASGGTTLLVIRPEAEVMIFPLELTEYTFLNMLASGETILTAAMAADWENVDSPMVESMLRYASIGFFSAMHIEE